MDLNPRINSRMLSHPILSHDEEVRVLTEIDNLEQEIIQDLFHPQIKAFMFEKLVECLTDEKENLDINSFDSIKKFLRFTDPGRKLFQKIIDSVKGKTDFIPKFRLKEKWASKILKKYNILIGKRNDFAAKNLRFVAKLSKFAFSTKPNLHDDLLQEGSMGLMKAIERFDVKKGFRFSTYANWWVKHHMRRYLVDKGETIRIPVHISDHAYVVGAIEKRFRAQNGRAPTYGELLETTGFTKTKLDTIIEIKNRPPMGSLDIPVGEKQDTTLIDLIADNKETAQETFENKLLKEVLDEAMKELKPFESYIIRNRYGIGTKDEMTLQQIGEIKSLSRERIRQIEFVAKQKLRKVPQLREFL